LGVASDLCGVDGDPSAKCNLIEDQLAGHAEQSSDPAVFERRLSAV
jgi:hypothetical protein